MKFASMAFCLALTLILAGCDTAQDTTNGTSPPPSAPAAGSTSDDPSATDGPALTPGASEDVREEPAQDLPENKQQD